MKQFGLSLDPFATISAAKALLTPANTANRQATDFASESFHAAVLRPATPTQPASPLDIWLRPAGARTFGDQRVLLEERRKNLELAGGQ